MRPPTKCSRSWRKTRTASESIMSKIKKGRVGVKLDMTAMVDVAFLLLIFYMSTTTFKPPEKVTVKLPESHANLKVPESDLLTIYVDKAGGVFVSPGQGDTEPVPVKQVGEKVK